MRVNSRSIAAPPHLNMSDRAWKTLKRGHNNGVTLWRRA